MTSRTGIGRAFSRAERILHLTSPMKLPPDYEITGRIRNEVNVAAVGHIVQAFDKDLKIYFHPDDRLGKAVTNSAGEFQIRFGHATFKDYFEDEPKVYVQVRDADGRVVVTTSGKDNTTGRIDFQIKLQKSETNPLESDLYTGNFDRMRTAIRNLGDSVDFSQEKTPEVFQRVSGALDSWLIYRDDLATICGYDGIQVPKMPRKEVHEHVTRWDEEVLHTP